jgi:murein DD-endopeptidase MepM/ murein hydrolase activator NlpD
LIENRELYSFEETGEPEPEASELETEFENTATGPSKFLYQSVVSVLCIVVAISICRLDQSWAYWARERFHYAINVSSQATFGFLWESPFFQNILRNGRNFIRLEKVTQTMSDPGISLAGEGLVLDDSVWPVPGNIVKEFGRSGPKSRFDTGVVIETTDQARVIAVATGTISRVDSISGGWVVEIEHKFGWSSGYQPITQVQVHQGQLVKAGQIIGRLSPGGDGKSRLFLEIKQNNQPVNPRAVIR